MIKTLTVPFGEQVGNKPVANVVGKGAKNPSCLIPSACFHGEAFHRNHAVATPFSKPVVASDHCSHFITRGVRSCNVFYATGGGNNELVCGHHQFFQSLILR